MEDQNTQSNQANSGQASSGQGGSGQGGAGAGSSSQGTEGKPGNQSGQGNKTGSDVPGTSKDPTGRVISDQSSQERNRQDPNSDRGGVNTPPWDFRSQQRSLKSKRAAE